MTTWIITFALVLGGVALGMTIAGWIIARNRWA